MRELVGAVMAFLAGWRELVDFVVALLSLLLTLAGWVAVLAGWLP